MKVKKFRNFIKILIVFSILSLFVIVLTSETVYFRDGKILSNVNITSDGNEIMFNETKYPISKVEKIIFSENKIDIKLPEEDNIPIEDILKTKNAALNTFKDIMDEYNGILLYDLGEFKLFENGKTYYKYHGIEYIKDASKFKMKNLQIGYDPDRDIPHIYKIRVIHQDGSFDSYNENENFIQDDSSGVEFYSKYKILNAVLPPISNGDILEYEYLTYSTPAFPKLSINSWYFQSTDEPFYISQIKYILPENEDLKYIAINMSIDDYDFNFKNENNYKVYTFKKEKIKPLKVEDLSPPLNKLTKSIQTSLFKTYDEIFDWYNPILKERMKVTPEIENFVNELTQNYSSKEEKLKVLYHWIQRNIKYVSIKGSLTSSLGGHPAIQTFKNKVGDCIDRAILFATMCKVIDVEAYPIIIQTYGNSYPFYEKLPNLRGNHAINEIYLNGKSFILDSTASDYSYPEFRLDDRNVYFINPLKRKIGFIPPADYKTMRNVFTFKGKLYENKDYFKGTVNLEFNSETKNILRFYFRNYKQYHDYIVDNLIIPNFFGNDFKQTGYKLHNYEDLSKNFTMDMNIKIKDFIKKAGKFYVLELKDSTIPGYMDDLFLDKNRTQNIEKNYQFDFQVTYEIDLGNYEIIALPENYSYEDKYYKVNFSYKIQNNKLLISLISIRKWTELTLDDLKIVGPKVLEFQKVLRKPILLKLNKK